MITIILERPTGTPEWLYRVKNQFGKVVRIKEIPAEWRGLDVVFDHYKTDYALVEVLVKDYNLLQIGLA